MKESSTPDNPLLYRYTRNQRAKETRMTRFKAIREKVKSQYPNDDIRAAEQVLAKATNHATDLAKFQDYVKIRAEVSPILGTFYTQQTTVHTQSKHQRHRLYPPPTLAYGNASHLTLRYNAYEIGDYVSTTRPAGIGENCGLGAGMV
ncbi:hypothetical protein H4R35_001932 [Dimargaris xerosporica]|nr:hypothetical protein H4R35_001932 [Dimargaris xerosporica]